MNRRKKVLAATLSCALLLSASAPAFAVRAPVKGAFGPLSASGETQRSYVISGSVAFDQLGSIIEKNNLTVRMMRERLASAKAMDWDEAYYDDINDGIDELEDTIDSLDSQKASLQADFQSATATGAEAFTKAVTAILAATAETEDISSIIKDLAEGSSNASMAVSYQSAIRTMPSKDDLQEKLDTAYDKLEEVKKQEEAHCRTLTDTERQIENIIDQTTAGAETFYLTILSTQNQLTALKDGAAATARMLEEMTLRCELGQVSKLTVAQMQNSYDKLTSSIPAAESGISTMKASLQSLLGELPDGELTLEDTPSVPDGAIEAIDYKADLAAAKSNSFSLYSADRTVEDAKRDWDDARKDNGKNSYQAKMAEHTYEAALLTRDSTVEGFELGFRQLYAALAPAQAKLATAEAALAYQEQTYAVAQLKYEQGRISKNALLTEEESLTTAKRDVETAKLDLFSAWNSYRQGVDCGLVSSPS